MMDTNNNHTTEATSEPLSSTGFSPLSINSDDLLNFDIQNCPTPDVNKLQDYLNDYDPFTDESNTEVMTLLQNAKNAGKTHPASFIPHDDGKSPALINDCMLSGSNDLAVVSPSSIFGNVMPVGSSSNSSMQQQHHLQHSSTPVASGSSSFDYSNNTFVPINEDSIKREEDNQTPFFGSDMLLNESNNSSTKSGRMRQKCMTKNAILARQNREKKKSEQKSITKRLEQLEEENASLKKKCNEYKNSLDNANTRVMYLEAVIQNLPQILEVMEHSSHLKGNPNVKSSGSSSKKT